MLTTNHMVSLWWYNITEHLQDRSETVKQTHLFWLYNSMSSTRNGSTFWEMSVFTFVS